MLADSLEELQQSQRHERICSHDGIDMPLLLLLQNLANLLDNKTCHRHCMCTSHGMTCLGLLDLITLQSS